MIFKFLTKISSQGVIKLPSRPDLFNREVEIIIRPKEKTEYFNTKAKDFCKKWGGVLSSNNPAEAKYDYLNEKYR
jgi:hypothetical protein